TPLGDPPCNFRICPSPTAALPPPPPSSSSHPPPPAPIRPPPPGPPPAPSPAQDARRATTGATGRGRRGRRSSEQEAAGPAILAYAERRMRKQLAELPAGEYSGEDQLDDDGSVDEPVPVRVKVTIRDGEMTLDFAGSAPQRRGNINAVAPMTHSAVFFAVKVLTDPTIPTNTGTFRPVDIRIPQGSFLNAQRPAAVCAGNTETTQRVVDAVLKVFAQFAPDRIPVP